MVLGQIGAKLITRRRARNKADKTCTQCGNSMLSNRPDDASLKNQDLKEEINKRFQIIQTSIRALIESVR
jgi:uncharacterized membrane protein YvbJ